MSDKLQKTTVWRFPQRGNWSSHKGDYRGNWAPQIPKNLILRYSSENDTVLDCFVGSGTTLIECKLNNRNGIGVDVNQNAIKISNERLNFETEFHNSIKLFQCDARNLDFIHSDSIDLIATHPPYSNAIKYSENIAGDLSLLSYHNFLAQLPIVANEMYRVLKKNKFCCIMIGDLRTKGNVVPLGFKLMQIYIESGFKIKEIIIKEQFNTKMSSYWEKISVQRNFLLLAHEYIFVFYK